MTAVLLSYSSSHIYILAYEVHYTHKVSFLFLSLSVAICSGHYYSWSLCIRDARYRGGGRGMLLGSGPWRLHCPDAAGFPGQPPLQLEGTQRSHF